MNLNEYEKTCVVSKQTLQYRFHRHLLYITCIFIISLLIPTPVKGLSSSLPTFLDVVDEQAKFFSFFLKVRENEMFYNVKQVTKYFKRCVLKKTRENDTRKTRNVAFFQTLWFVLFVKRRL